MIQYNTIYIYIYVCARVCDSKWKKREKGEKGKLLFSDERRNLRDWWVTLPSTRLMKKM